MREKNMTVLPKTTQEQLRKPSGEGAGEILEFMETNNQPYLLWALDYLAAQPDQTILEIGPGPGFAINQLLRSIPRCHVTALDYSAEVIEHCRKRFSAAVEEEKLSLQVGTLETSHFGQHRFDRIFSAHVVYFIPDIASWFKGLNKLMMPSGRLVVHFDAPESFKGAVSPEIFTLRSAADLEVAAQDAGFNQVEIVTKVFESGDIGHCLIAEG